MYLSFAGCVRPVEVSLSGPRVGHTVSFGLSDNRVKTVDNAGANHIGYDPKDDTEPFRAAIEERTAAPDPRSSAACYLGGWFCELGHPDDEPG